MSTPTPAQTPTHLQVAPEIESSWQAEMRAMLELIGEQNERIAALEAKVLPQPKDDLNERILGFMKGMPGIRLTALVIAENIGEANSRVGSRLASLASRGAIRSSKEEGRNRLYFHP